MAMTIATFETIGRLFTIYKFRTMEQDADGTMRVISFRKDLQMIVCTLLGRKMEYGGEMI